MKEIPSDSFPSVETRKKYIELLGVESEEQDEIQEDTNSMEEKLVALGQLKLGGIPKCGHSQNNIRNDIAYCAKCYSETGKIEFIYSIADL